MPIFIAIPTYDRLNVFRKKTYNKIIKQYNLEKYVTLFIQSDKDATEYKEAFPELKQVRSPKGYLNTLNFIGTHYPLNAKVVKMDDDITQIKKLQGNKLVDVNSAYDLFNKTFGIMSNVGANIGGYYPIPTASYMEGRKPITTDLRFIVGSMYCFVNKRIKLKIDGKSDYELTIEYYKRDGKVVRLNHYSFRYDYSDNTEKSGKDTQIFINKYEEYISKVVKHKNGTTSFVLRKSID